MRISIIIFSILFFCNGLLAQVELKQSISIKGQKIYAAAYNNNGKYIAVATEDKNIQILSGQNYQLIATLKGLKQIPTTLAFSDNNKYLAAAGEDKKITVWSLVSAQIYHVFKGHKDKINHIVFNPDNLHIASASNDKTIVLWNVTSKKQEKVFKGHLGEVSSIDFSTDGKFLASASSDKTVKIWNVNSGLETKTIDLPKKINTLKFNSDASVIVTGGDDKHITFWDVLSGERLNTLFTHKEGIQTIDFSSDGNYMLSGGSDKLIIITNLKSGLLSFKSKPQSGAIKYVQFSPDGKSFLGLAEGSNKLLVWGIDNLNIKALADEKPKTQYESSFSVPVISLESHKTNDEVYDASVKLTGTIKSESSLRSIEFYLNGELFATKNRSELMLEIAKDNNYKFSEVVVLKVGSNTIQIRSKNIVGEGVSDEIRLFFLNLPDKPLSWISPAQPKLETYSKEFELKALINPSVSKQNVNIYVNDKKQAIKLMPANGGILSQKITLESGENNIKITISTTKFEKEAEKRTLTFVAPKTPIIAWESPTKDTIANISSGRIRASVNSKIPINKIELLVNGIVVYSKSKTGLTWLTIDRQVQLPEKSNTIIIKAENSEGQSTSDARIISYIPPEKTNISWVSPGSDTVVFESVVSLNACIQSKTTVSKYEIFNNNELIASENNPKEGNSAECLVNLLKSIQLKQGVNSIKISAENSGGVTFSDVRKINYTIPAIANITWVKPTSLNSTVSSGTVTIKACIESNSPLNAYTILLNKKIFSNVRNPQPSTGNCNYEIELTLPLQSGDNQIILRAANLSGDAMSKPIIVKTKTANPYRFALIFGNEDYSSYQSGLDSESDVDYAINDAVGFKDACVNYLNIKEENILYYENARFMEMTRALAKISAIIKSTTGKADVIVYYAGHGFPHEQTHIPYIIPVDVSGSDLEFGGIKLTEFYGKLTEYPSNRVTVFIDACFSGGARNQGLMSARGVKIKPKKADESIKKKLVVFTASSGSQTSLPYTEEKHGMFTYFLLKEIEETQGNILYSELSEYLKQKVSIRSIMVNNKEQDPQTNISPEIVGEWKNYILNE